MDYTYKPIKNIFGERLRQIRNQKRLTLDEVASAVRTTKATLSRYENGKMIPTLYSAKALADYLAVSLDWLTTSDSDLQEG